MKLCRYGSVYLNSNQFLIALHEKIYVWSLIRVDSRNDKVIPKGGASRVLAAHAR